MTTTTPTTAPTTAETVARTLANHPDGITVRDLATEAGIGASTAAKALATMETTGTATRTPGPANGNRKSADIWHPVADDAAALADEAPVADDAAALADEAPVADDAAALADEAPVADDAAALADEAPVADDAAALADEAPVADDAAALADEAPVADDAAALADEAPVADDAAALADEAPVADDAAALADEAPVADDAAALADEAPVADDAAALADEAPVADDAAAPADEAPVADDAAAPADEAPVADDAAAPADEAPAPAAPRQPDLKVLIMAGVLGDHPDGVSAAVAIAESGLAPATGDTILAAMEVAGAARRLPVGDDGEELWVRGDGDLATVDPANAPTHVTCPTCGHTRRVRRPSATGRRTGGTGRATGDINSDGSPKLGKNGLRNLVEAFMRDLGPGHDVTPGTAGRELGGRSSGACLNAMNALTGLGVLVMTNPAPVHFAMADNPPAPSPEVAALMTRPAADAPASDGDGDGDGDGDTSDAPASDGDTTDTPAADEALAA